MDNDPFNSLPAVSIRQPLSPDGAGRRGRPRLLYPFPVDHHTLHRLQVLLAVDQNNPVDLRALLQGFDRPGQDRFAGERGQDFIDAIHAPAFARATIMAQTLACDILLLLIVYFFFFERSFPVHYSFPSALWTWLRIRPLKMASLRVLTGISSMPLTGGRDLSPLRGTRQYLKPRRAASLIRLSNWETDAVLRLNRFLPSPPAPV